VKPFQESAVIEKPVEEVFAFAANPQNDPLWSPAVAEARQSSNGSLGIGTTFQQVLRLLGRRVEITFVVTGFEQNRMLEIGRFSGQGGSGLFHNLLEPLVAGAARRQARRSLAHLKDALEGQARRS
jgi:hypothetical protein